MESAVTRSAAAVARRHGNLRGHARKIAQRASLRAAKAAGLRHVSDTIPGYRRHKRGKTFTYTDGRGKQLKDARVLQRIRSLVIPPAWTQVWICPLDNGHLQVTGYDGRGRKQYRYHRRWREVPFRARVVVKRAARERHKENEPAQTCFCIAIVVAMTRGPAICDARRNVTQPKAVRKDSLASSYSGCGSLLQNFGRTADIPARQLEPKLGPAAPGVSSRCTQITSDRVQGPSLRSSVATPQMLAQ